MATEPTRDDPSLVLPAAVRAQAERANSMISAMNQPPADLQQGQGQGQGQEQDDDAQRQAPETDPAHIAQNSGEPVQPGAQPEQDTGTLEQQLTALKAKYDSVNGRYRTSEKTIRTLQDQITALQNVIASMNEVQVTKGPELKVEKLLTAEEENEYGKDLLDVVGKRAKEVVSPMLVEMAKQIEDLTKLVRGLGSQVQVRSEKDIKTTLDEKLPQWRELNRDDRFLEWLALPDAYSGAIRHELLKAAYARGDANRVLAFFNGYLSEEAATTPAGTTQPNPTPARPAKVSLGSLAAPGRAKTAAAPLPAPDKPIFTRAEISRFYADVAAGVYRGRDSEKDELERQIFSAQNDGRIR